MLFYMLLLASGGSYAQQVKDFSLLNAADGKTVSLSQYKQYQWIVLVFASNECAYMNYYIDRLIMLGTTYRQAVQFIFINPNTGPAEEVAAMQLKYRQWKLEVPYLADKQQVVMTALGAQKSPEVFLLKGVKETYTVVYRGAIDDNPQVAGDVGHSYLKDAIDWQMGGEKTGLEKTRPVGCTIRKK